MGKWLSIVVGVILAALGLAGIIGWWSEGVWQFVRSGVVLAAFFIGIGAIIFGIGELRAPAEIPPVAQPSSSTEEEASGDSAS